MGCTNQTVRTLFLQSLFPRFTRHETLLRRVIGPCGRLGSPPLKLGKTLIVSFDQDLYEILFAPT